MLNSIKIEYALPILNLSAFAGYCQGQSEKAAKYPDGALKFTARVCRSSCPHWVDAVEKWLVIICEL